MRIAFLTNRYIPYWWIPTFVSHLYKTLIVNGCWVDNYYLSWIKRKTDNMKLYDNHCPYKPLYYKGNQTELKSYECIIITSWFFDKKTIHYSDSILSKTIWKKFIVIHDPAEIEWNKLILKLIKKHFIKVITIRPTTRDYLLNKYWIESKYIRHPYFRVDKRIKNVEKKWFICTARIDFDKYYWIIVESQQIQRNDIKIYWYPNRLCLHFIKEKYNWDWKEIIDKRFTPDEVESIYSKAKWLIDMSLFKDDWGWTQYTFLEAWDFWVIPIINSGWLRNWGDMVNNINCIGVKDSLELSSVLQNINIYKDILNNFEKCLEKHDPKKIWKEYIDYFKS